MAILRLLRWARASFGAVVTLFSLQMVDVGQQLQSKCRLFFFYFHILSCHKQMASRERERGVERGWGKEAHKGGEGAPPGHISPGLAAPSLITSQTLSPPRHVRTREAHMSWVGLSLEKVSAAKLSGLFFLKIQHKFFWGVSLYLTFKFTLVPVSLHGVLLSTPRFGGKPVQTETRGIFWHRRAPGCTAAAADNLWPGLLSPVGVQATTGWLMGWQRCVTGHR